MSATTTARAPAEKTVPKQTTRSRQDFVSDQEVRWCPGCGDYSILAQTQKTMADIGLDPDKVVCISGIGCSSRFPYYLNTYGFHSIHGRAPTLATGLKIARPDLDVWVITGDGDALSIGGNHFLHALRRNIDINILLFNNRIYGLTKGQYSPTSRPGQKTKSTPYGGIDQPINPLCLALAAEATFVARSVDTDPKHLMATLKRAAEHKGVSFVEIYQNCVIFNDGAFKDVTDRATRSDRILQLEHGKPMVFGKNRDKGIRMDGIRPQIVTLGDAAAEEDLLVHDEALEQPTLAYFLSRMEFPEFPVPMGVFRAVEKPPYSLLVKQQEEEVRARLGEGNLQTLLMGPATWDVKEDPS